LALPVAVLLALSLADRLLVGVVEHRISDRLACLGGLTGARAVHIHGSPFLTQAASGHYGAVTVTADGIRDASRLTEIAVTFRDLHLPPLSGLVGEPSPDSVTVGSIVITTTIRFISPGSLVTGPSAPPTGSLSAFGAAGPGPLAGAWADGLPFPGHLDAVRPVAGGARLTLSVPGTAVKAAVGRLGSDCGAVAPAPPHAAVVPDLSVRPPHE
jgi:hypothetical protein